MIYNHFGVALEGFLLEDLLMGEIVYFINLVENQKWERPTQFHDDGTKSSWAFWPFVKKKGKKRLLEVSKFTIGNLKICYHRVIKNLWWTENQTIYISILLFLKTNLQCVCLPLVKVYIKGCLLFPNISLIWKLLSGIFFHHFIKEHGVIKVSSINMSLHISCLN